MPDAIQPDKEQKRLIRMAETISKALPYMRRHNDATFVVKYGGHAMTDPKLGDLFARDIVLMKQVGMNPIVVHGGGPQINKMLDRVGIKSQFVNGLRVTDDVALSCAKEASGRMRVEIEALLSMGLPNSPMAGSDIRVASGNFVTAKPIGVVDGVDLLHTGEVRKVDATGIRDRLDHNELVLLSPIGYSPTGEIFLSTVATRSKKPP